MALDNKAHIPVLLQEVMESLLPENVKTVFDGTLGLGGHGEAILTAYSEVDYVACDLDEEHLEFASQRLQKFRDRIWLHHGSFTQMGDWLSDENKRPLAILLDLGLCSNHVDNPDKGFSFDGDGPLNMAFDGTQKRNAEIFLQRASEQDIHRVIRDYGEEPFSKGIAKNIVKAREVSPLQTTHDLRIIVEASVYPQDRKKALTRVFQALRIEINNELKVLKDALETAFSVMKTGDRLGIISYHSLEDRIVKQAFKEASQPITKEGIYSKHEVVAPASFSVLTKKPMEPKTEEKEINPRSRSAKFRIIEKI